MPRISPVDHGSATGDTKEKAFARFEVPASLDKILAMRTG